MSTQFPAINLQTSQQNISQQLIPHEQLMDVSQSFGRVEEHGKSYSEETQEMRDAVSLEPVPVSTTHVPLASSSKSSSQKPPGKIDKITNVRKTRQKARLDYLVFHKTGEKRRKDEN